MTPCEPGRPLHYAICRMIAQRNIPSTAVVIACSCGVVPFFAAGSSGNATATAGNNAACDADAPD